MAGSSLASAVALPESRPAPSSPESGLKRRKSSDSDADRKRRRLSGQDELSSPVQAKQSSPPPASDRTAERRISRRGGGAAEERRRGQRLFGALIGTLSQSSSTTAQKRRADIEKRQQAKLKLQDEEYGEKKRREREEVTANRRRQQQVYDKEAMNTRHSNMLAMAHFLKTKTEPILYYKPWQLRGGDEDIITKQIEDAESIIAKEIAEFETRYPPESEDHDLAEKDSGQAGGSACLDKDPGEENEITGDTMETVGSEIDRDRDTEIPRDDTTATASANDHAQSITGPVEAPRQHEDDGGEVVEEDKEDTVIY